MKKTDDNALSRVKLSEQHLKELHSNLPQFKADSKELWGLLAAMPEEKWEGLFRGDFS